MRRGHVPLLHIYPAARPPAACRAVLCASLWPDPVDPLCPAQFREMAEREMQAFARAVVGKRELSDACDNESWKRYGELAKSNTPLTHEALRKVLLDFIADFASWEASTQPTFLGVARRITSAAHSSLASDGSQRPLIVDSFAGGGAIPLEAARLDADAFASDSSPVAVLLNKVILELVPAHKEELLTEVRNQIAWIRAEAANALQQLYPLDTDGAVPTTFLWARTITCEGPGCGATIPLIRSLRLVRKESRALSLKIVPRPERKMIDFELVRDGAPRTGAEGTVRRGSATCPICGYTTRVDSVRRQLTVSRGGVREAQLLAVVTTRKDDQGRSYRLPTPQDSECRANGDPGMGHHGQADNSRSVVADTERAHLAQ